MLLNGNMKVELFVLLKPNSSYCMGVSRGGQGVRTPLKNHKNKGFHNMLVRIYWKITRLPSQHSMLGHHRLDSEMPFHMTFRWRGDGGPLLVVFGYSSSSSTKNNNDKKKKKKKNPKKQRCQSWTPSDKTFWIRACYTY